MIPRPKIMSDAFSRNMRADWTEQYWKTNSVMFTGKEEDVDDSGNPIYRILYIDGTHDFSPGIIVSVYKFVKNSNRKLLRKEFKTEVEARAFAEEYMTKY